MNKVNSPRLKEGLKKTKNIFIWSIVFIIITIGIGTWAFLTKNGNYESISMNSIFSSNPKENVYSHIEANLTPYVFAEQDNTTNKYYLVKDLDRMYIAYLSPENYKKLSKENIEQNPIKITGTTKKITNNIKSLAINAYNELAGENIVNTNNFEKYLGTVLLDTTDQPTDTKLQIFLIIGTASIAIILLLLALVKKKKTNKKINNFTSNEWALIEEEIESTKTIYYKKLKLYLTEHYIINLVNSIDIIPYDDILWMYPHILKHNGKTTAKDIIIIQKNKMKYQIANTNNFSEKNEEDYNNIMDFIYNKNNNITIGYSKENIQKMEDLYQIK